MLMTRMHQGSYIVPLKIAHQKKVRNFEASIEAGALDLSPWPVTATAYQNFLQDWWPAIVASSRNCLGVGGGGSLLTLVMALTMQAKYAPAKSTFADYMAVSVASYVQGEIDACWGGGDM
jgi:hypothetical protein